MKLPEKYINKNQIKNMKVEERRFTVPWAIVVAPNRECFLRSEYTTDAAPKGTASMEIVRESGGYAVRPTDWFSYHPSESLPDYSTLIPVHRLIES